MYCARPTIGEELHRAVDAGSDVIGINNRDRRGPAKVDVNTASPGWVKSFREM